MWHISAYRGSAARLRRPRRTCLPLCRLSCRTVFCCCASGSEGRRSGRRGNAYSLCRTHIQSCDFALSNYSYVRPFDSSLRSFTISRDRQLLLLFIKCGLCGEPAAAVVRKPLEPAGVHEDQPPHERGGKLRRSQYEVWAEVLAKYVDAYLREGVRISRMSVQNEPMASQAGFVPV